MYLTLQIAIGIWLGGVFLAGTFYVVAEVATKIARNNRFGAPWYRLRRI